MPASNHKKETVDKELLKRYFANNASSEDEAIIRQWLTEPVNQREVLDFIEASWKEGMVEEAQVTSFHELFEKALREERERNKVVSLYNRPWVWAAACALFLVAGTWMGYHLKGKTDAGGWVLSTATTGKGERTRLLLSDGSEVYLNSNTRLTFPRQLDMQKELYLEGEAYFNIKSAEKPLTIRTKEIVTTAKGSKINISAFPKDSTVTVSVEKGKAEISSGNEYMPLLKLRFPAKDSALNGNEANTQPKILPLVKLVPAVVKENQSMVFDKGSMTGGVTNMLTGVQYSTWKDGILSFMNAEAPDIAVKLERWFGVKVYMDASDVVLYSGEFRNASLKDVLQHISESLNVKYRIKKDTVYIYQ